MEREPHLQKRQQLLDELTALRCQASEVDAIGTFIVDRAVLLGELEALGGPWSAQDQQQLRKALAYGESVLTEVTRRRNEMAKQLNQVQSAKRRSRASNHAENSRFKRVI